MRFSFAVRLAASFEESELALVQELRAVLLHQKCRRNAEAEQKDVVEVWNGKSGSLLQQPVQVADFSVSVRRVPGSVEE